LHAYYGDEDDGLAAALACAVEPPAGAGSLAACFSAQGTSSFAVTGSSGYIAMRVGPARIDGRAVTAQWGAWHDGEGLGNYWAVQDGQIIIKSPASRIRAWLPLDMQPGQTMADKRNRVTTTLVDYETFWLADKRFVNVCRLFVHESRLNLWYAPNYGCIKQSYQSGAVLFEYAGDL
jgi:hypothetical protein